MVKLFPSRTGPAGAGAGAGAGARPGGAASGLPPPAANDTLPAGAIPTNDEATSTSTTHERRTSRIATCPPVGLGRAAIRAPASARRTPTLLFQRIGADPREACRFRQYFWFSVN